ncbi:MAG TPA: copper-binding protein [Steroidobacteraceae bacterium]|nr:copper-binding protein [Steroidobacteraceae bacterium]
MKRLSTLALLVTTSLAALTATAADPQNGMNMPGMQMSGAASARKEKIGRTSGKVVQIDATGSRITIAHHPVPALGWPAMTMTFKSSSQKLKGIKAGDQVDFEFYVHSDGAVIERIHKIG